MPFKSKKQMRFMFAAEKRSEVPPGTAERWAAETPSIAKLPLRAPKKAKAPVKPKRNRRV